MIFSRAEIATLLFYRSARYATSRHLRGDQEIEKGGLNKDVTSL
jgi:hypothetical protein